MRLRLNNEYSEMKNITTKEFIDSLFVQELGMLVSSSPYISFMIVSVGIEFLG
jgi:hypothetical protein